MHDFTKKLSEKLHEAADNNRKAGAEAYMRNQFSFIGMDTISRREIFKKFISNYGLPAYEDLSTIIIECWGLEREMQYCAIELAAKFRKDWDVSFIEIIHFCIVNKSWWDSVDAIASQLSGPYFKKFPTKIKPVTGTWNRSGNIWLQRSSLLFQLKYRDTTDNALLSKYILRLSGSREFFIQKAIGWILREYSKTNPRWVKAFVSENPLKPLSIREALKNMIM
jgi:3-methyladenine DNA glycosylase AlkD